MLGEGFPSAMSANHLSAAGFVPPGTEAVEQPLYPGLQPLNGVLHLTVFCPAFPRRPLRTADRFVTLFQSPNFTLPAKPGVAAAGWALDLVGGAGPGGAEIVTAHTRRQPGLLGRAASEMLRT